ncbi:hypothetical protein BKA91DRAFT_134185 [Yarrowia lipolytica]|nr:hypothetical protein BKA91DRAFT_134185 [Yarrowia lipolytica]KAE8175076.1 hypothetical protein BKA90DRAFT_132834 [Yarrowia lipolytica]RMJ01297.1 hypothetical protein BD777DRAFT_122137 [Yarrowia lipolytica]
MRVLGHVIRVLGNVLRTFSLTISLRITTEATKVNRMKSRRSSQVLGQRPPTVSPEPVAVNALPSPLSGVFDTPF